MPREVVSSPRALLPPIRALGVGTIAFTGRQLSERRETLVGQDMSRIIADDTIEIVAKIRIAHGIAEQTVA